MRIDMIAFTQQGYRLGQKLERILNDEGEQARLACGFGKEKQPLSHLTTIKQDTDQIGKEAADRLISIIEKPKTALMERVVIEGILLKGESVGRV